MKDCRAATRSKASFAGQMGTALEPIIKPLGYDWRIGIGLIGSFAAREVFVSTMSIVFNLGDEAGRTLCARLSRPRTGLTDVHCSRRWCV